MRKWSSEECRPERAPRLLIIWHRITSIASRVSRPISGAEGVHRNLCSDACNFWSILGAGTPVCPHSTRFERAHSYAERSHLLGKGFGKAPDCPFGGVIRRAAGPGQTPTHGRNLKDAAALLLAHDWKRGAGHVDYAVEVGIDHGLESFRTQLLEGRKITVARVVHHDIKLPERIYCGLHSRIGRILVCHIQGGSADLVAVLLHHIVKATGIAGCCHEASARCEDRFSDVTAQTASASRYQPNFGHKNLLCLRFAKSCHQTVGIVPPSITNSVPVIEDARPDATKATSSATSWGWLGRPSGIPPSMSISFWRAVP